MDYASLIGSLFNGAIQIYSMFKNGDELEQAKKDLKTAYDKLRAEYESGKIDANQFKNGAYQVLGADPVTASALRSNQMDALRQLAEIGASNGLDAQSQEANALAGQQYEQARSQDRQAIAEKYQRQGRWGSGQEIMSQLQSGQDSANALRNSGLTNAANARKRALEAITQSGQLSGQIRGQDEQLAERNRQAENERQQFNAKMKQAGNADYLNALQYNQGLAGGAWNAASNYNNYLATGRAENAANLRNVGSVGQNMITGIGAAGQGGGSASQSQGLTTDNLAPKEYSNDDPWNQYPYSKKSIVEEGDK